MNVMAAKSAESVTRPEMRKPRLAIVSTLDDLCGIAGYTRFLVKQLESCFDIEVFDLDQFFMRSTDRNVRKLADKMVKEFCARASGFEVVNIQLEFGIFGPRRQDFWRRFSWIAKSAPALSVTFHTVLPQEPLDFSILLKMLSNANFSAAWDALKERRMATTTSLRMYRLLRRLQLVKPVSIIVHTRRDSRLMRYVNRLKNVYDHPLAFLSQDEVERFHSEAARSNFPILARLPQRIKVVGVFGFLNDYKGFELAIRALQRLPKSYHLAIFGALHPNEIKRRESIHPYVARLLDEAYVRKSVLGENSKHAVSVSIDSTTARLLYEHPLDISNRVHFMGAQTDEDFARAMAVCDYAVFPYLEVGQSSSGPISIALEMGVRVIAARTRTFMQLERYHQNSFEMFEIGNHVELASRILSASPFKCGVQQRRYDAKTNTEVYMLANSTGQLNPAERALLSIGRKMVNTVIG